MNGILVIAHAPLASALRLCVLHVFPDAGPSIAALDVPPNQPPEETLDQARVLVSQMGADQTLVLTDLFGAGEAATKLEEIRASFSQDHKPRLADVLAPPGTKSLLGMRPIVWVGIMLAVFQQLVGINVIFYYGATLW
ncbi:MAG: MFS transporter, partial [Burkholderiaceae bacterium]